MMAVSPCRTTVGLFRLNLEYSPTLGCACQITHVNSQFCETSKATSSFSIILSVCECFLVFLETPWTDSIEDVSVHGAGAGEMEEQRIHLYSPYINLIGFLMSMSQLRCSRELSS